MCAGTDSGSLTLATSNAGSSGVSGDVSMSSGTSSAGNSGSLSLSSGNAAGGTGGAI